MFIQLTVLGFEPTAYSAWVSSHNNSTSAPAHLNFFFKFLNYIGGGGGLVVACLSFDH